jgi:hypothetical protein
MSTSTDKRPLSGRTFNFRQVDGIYVQMTIIGILFCGLSGTALPIRGNLVRTKLTWGRLP